MLAENEAGTWEARARILRQDLLPPRLASARAPMTAGRLLLPLATYQSTYLGT